MEIWNYNKERKSKGWLDIYLQAILFGGALAIFLIASGLGLRFLIEFLIKNWVWVAVMILALIFIKRFFLQRKQE